MWTFYFRNKKFLLVIFPRHLRAICSTFLRFAFSEKRKGEGNQTLHCKKQLLDWVLCNISQQSCSYYRWFSTTLKLSEKLEFRRLFTYGRPSWFQMYWGGGRFDIHPRWPRVTLRLLDDLTEKYGDCEQPSSFVTVP